jgi:hypothetical protein
MQAAPAQALDVEAHRVLKGHGGNGEPVFSHAAQKTIEGLQVFITAAVFVFFAATALLFFGFLFP